MYVFGEGGGGEVERESRAGFGYRNCQCSLRVSTDWVLKFQTEERRAYFVAIQKKENSVASSSEGKEEDEFEGKKGLSRAKPESRHSHKGAGGNLCAIGPRIGGERMTSEKYATAVVHYLR